MILRVAYVCVVEIEIVWKYGRSSSEYVQDKDITSVFVF